MSPRSGRLARQQQRRRRREQVGGAIVAGVGIVVAIVAVIALSHPHDHSTAAGTATRTVTATPTSSAPSNSAAHSSSTAPADSSASAATASSSTTTAAAKLPLVVLNNTTITHLAADAAATFRAGGWTVTSAANYTNDIISTCAYYDPNVAGAHAAALALQAQFPAIVRVEPQFDGLQQYNSPIVVILTPDYTTA